MSEAPLFSVVIPSRNGRDRLKMTLESISRTEIDLERVEVIVVDDGSTDGTVEAFRDRRYPFRFQLHRVAFASQSATTNEALRHATGRYVLSSAQDILFHPRMFAEHLAFHERFDDEVVVMGNLPYPASLDVTPFMFYLVSGGYQFAFYLIRDPFHVPPNFLYAPNFSAPREVLTAAGGFDARFPFGCQDTDLGIRLARSGVRMVYNPSAIGYHNHPITIEEYARRQVTVGRALVHLAKKHPDYEGGVGLHDLIVQHYLMCSDVKLDRFHESVARLERLLAERPTYPSLWEYAFCERQPTTRLEAPDVETLGLTDQLFGAYHGILSFHLGRGFLLEACECQGVERVGEWLEARLIKTQASHQVWRTVERRLAEHDLAPSRPLPGECRYARVVTGLDGYADAMRYLERYENPPAGRCAEQVVLVVDPATLDEDEAIRLQQLVDVVLCDDPDEGVGKAIARCSAELVAVISSEVEPLHPRERELAERLFSRIPGLTVLGGVVDGEPGGARRVGYRHGGDPIHGSDPGISPVEVANPELCWLRRSALPKADDNFSQRWNFELCRRVASAGGLVLQVPELAVRRAERQATASIRG